MGIYGEEHATIAGHADVHRTMNVGGPSVASFRLSELPGWSFAISSGRLAWLSPSLAAWLGYETSATLLGASSHALLAGTPPQGRTQGRVLLALLRRDGSLVHLEMAELEVSLGGEPSLLFWAPGQNAELQERPARSSRLSAVTAGLAHELNNPLTYLTLNLDFAERELGRLREGTEAEREGALLQTTESLRVAREGVERLSAIVRDLRAFSRAGEGIRVVDPRRLLELAFALTRNSLRHKARLQIELHDVADVDANEAELGQSLVGLLLLILHQIEDGASVEHLLEIRLEQANESTVEIKIAMSGPNAQQNLGNDPEFMGLQARIAAFGGQLVALGAEATLRLQVSGAERSSKPVTSIPPPSQLSVRPRVLLIEDEPKIAEALRTLLGEEAEVDHVASGRQAIEVLLRDQRYQLILCDLMMPDIGGIDVHEAVRRARPGVERRIVFLTGGVFSQRTRDFLRSTPNRTLDKPVDPGLLLSLVRSLPRG